jgi:hypothetical protein
MQELVKGSRSNSHRAAGQTEPSPEVGFRRYLEAFVFFHLGADAELSWSRDESGIEVGIEHSRIRPTRFRLSPDQLREMVDDSRKEEFLLDVLTQARK